MECVKLREEIVKDNVKINSYGFVEDEKFHPLSISESDYVGVGLDRSRLERFFCDNEKKISRNAQPENGCIHWQNSLGKEIWVKNDNIVSNILSSEIVTIEFLETFIFFICQHHHVLQLMTIEIISHIFLT